jgi:hypothetical protein
MAMNKQRKSSNLINILSYDDAGNIVLRDYSQTIRYNWNGTIHAFTGPLSISSIAAAVTDTDRFLVSDGGVLKYRTGTEVLSDIGGVPSTRTLTINGVTQDLSVNRTFTIAAGITGTGADGQVAYWNGTSSQTGSNNLFWDAANSRLGIGTNAPSTTLDIRGKTRIQSSGNAELDIIDGSNSLRLAMGSTQGFVGTLSSHPFGFFTGALKRGEFSTNGNFILQNGGTFIDGGQRLQVQGDAFIKGSGATSGTNALLVQNSGGTDLFAINNSGYYRLSGSNGLFISQFTTTQGSVSISGTNTQFYNYTTTQAATFGAFSFHGDNFTQTSGAAHTLFVSKAFYPTSGTATHSTLSIAPAINQTGGANGITRGLYVTPTIVAAADWRSIEWSNNSGWGLYGAGTAPNYLAGYLIINDGSGYAIRLLNNKRIAGHSGGGGSEIDLSLAAIIAGYNSLNIRTQLSGNITFQTGGANTRMQVFGATGNVVLQDGGTFTDAGFRLDVNGTARVSGAATFSSTIQGTIITATSYFASDYYRDSRLEAMLIYTGSNQIRLGSGVDTDFLSFYSGALERMRITAGGNLLVGTTADQGYRVQITSASADSQLNVWGATAPSIRLDNAASGATQRLVFGLATATNNFIIGAASGDICLTTQSTSPLLFGANSTEAMRISTSANVLIRKTADGGQPLQVNGKVNFASLPTSATGLAAGDIWNNGGVLNIV